MKKIFTIIIIASFMSCTYLKNRRYDALDTIILTADAGTGVSSYIHAGPIGIGVGYWDGYTFGLERKANVGTSEEWYLGYPINIFSELYGRHSVSNIITCGYQVYQKNIMEYQRQYEFIITGFNHTGYDGYRAENICWIEYFSLEVSGRIFIGFKLGINPAELLDFVLGLFLIDIASDDIKSEQEEHADIEETDFDVNDHE